MNSGHSESFKKSTDELFERRLTCGDSSETEGAGEAGGGQGNLEKPPSFPGFGCQNTSASDLQPKVTGTWEWRPQFILFHGNVERAVYNNTGVQL